MVTGWLGEMLEWHAEDEPTANRAAGLIMKAQSETEERVYREIEKWFREHYADSAADVVNSLYAVRVLNQRRVVLEEEEKRNARLRAHSAVVVESGDEHD